VSEKSNEEDLIRVSALTNFVDHPDLLNRDSSTTFHIASQFEEFDGSKRHFCLQAASKMVGSALNVRPCCKGISTVFCNQDKLQLQEWFMDPLGQLRLKIDSSKCIQWVNSVTPLDRKDLKLGKDCACTNADSNPTYAFFFDQYNNEIYINKEENKFWLRPNKDVVKPVKLSSFGERDHIINKWYLKWVIYSSEQPSSLPTTSPTNMPSDSPSTKPSTNPSPVPTSSPTSQPSPFPSSSPSHKPSNKPSLIPSNEPSLLPSNEPSLIPSDEPSLLPSDKPSLIPSDNPSLLPSDDPSVFPSDQVSFFLLILLAHMKGLHHYIFNSLFSFFVSHLYYQVLCHQHFQVMR